MGSLSGGGMGRLLLPVVAETLGSLAAVYQEAAGVSRAGPDGNRDPGPRA